MSSDQTNPPSNQPAEPKKKRGCFGKLGIGCGGLIALIVVIVLITSMTGNSSKKTTHAAVSTTAANAATTTAATTARTTQPPQSTKASATQAPQLAWGTNKGDVHVQLQENAVGEIPDPGTKGIHKITITKVTDDAQSTNQFDHPAEGNKYWVVEATVQNTGQAEITLGNWKLRTSDDVEHDVAFAAGLGDALSPLQKLTPGGKAQGVVIFEVAKDATPKFLRYDPNTFAKGDLYFDGQSPLKP